MTTPNLLRAGAFLVLLFTLGPVNGGCDEKDLLPASMVGTWSGQARIIVVWCQQTNLFVQVKIAPNGQVTGKVGDATIRNGRFKQNRGWVGRKLNLKTDYIITGDLEGPIVAAENISRRSVRIPLNLSNGVLTGGVHSGGTHLGTKKSMVLSAAGLRLVRKDSNDKKSDLSLERSKL